MNDTITYEHPLNEVIRVCLRLEQLFQQIDHEIMDNSVIGARNSILLIIHLLQILDRPDLKTKLAKEISQLISNLTRYNESPNIDASKLQDLIDQLKAIASNLIDSTGKIGHRLRDIEFLNNLRLHVATPGGACSFDIPLFHYWLQQTPQVRQETLKLWLSDFSQIRHAISLVLDLVRRNAKTEEKTATHGFHQELLDPQSALRMIRISIPKDLSTFPEISIGRHFMSIRFFDPVIEKRPQQYNQNLPFLLTYCHS